MHLISRGLGNPTLGDHETTEQRSNPPQLPRVSSRNLSRTQRRSIEMSASLTNDFCKSLSSTGSKTRNVTALAHSESLTPSNLELFLENKPRLSDIKSKWNNGLLIEILGLCEPFKQAIDASYIDAAVATKIKENEKPFIPLLMYYLKESSPLLIYLELESLAKKTN